MVVVDGRGVPVGAQLASAQLAECRLAESTLATVKVPRKGRGRPRSHLKRVIADRGYDSDALRMRFHKRQTELIVPYRKSIRNRRFEDKRKLRRYRKRWKIERTNAWLQNFRRIQVRYDRILTVFQGFFHCACLLIALRHLCNQLYRLKVSLLFEKPIVPALRIAINDKYGVFYPQPKLDLRLGDTGNGTGNPAYSNADILFDFPGFYLHKGTNTMTLQAVEDVDEAAPGSGFSNGEIPGIGFTYDAIELDGMGKSSAGLQSFARILPTVFYRQANGQINELVGVIVRSSKHIGPGSSAALTVAGKRHEQRLDANQDFGETKLEFSVAEFSAHTVAQLSFSADGATQHMEQIIDPEKKWMLFLVPHVHLDIGFTDYQSKVAVIQSRILDQAMDLIARIPAYRFSMDGEWTLEQFMKTRTPAEQRRVVAAIKRNELFVPAQLSCELTGFPTAETLIRSLYSSANFSRKYGTPFDYANITDVPSYSWSYASILASAGIHEFIAASNNHRAPVLLRGHLNENSPFWWEGPDGQKILFWYSRHYSQLSSLFGMPPVISAGRDTIPLYLQQYQGSGYRASAAIMYGVQGDNTELFPQQAELAEKWNRIYAYPRIQYSGFHEALENIREQMGSEIPTISGDGGPYWELGIGSDAYYAAKERENESRGPSAEKLSTLASLVDPRIAVDKTVLDQMWNEMVLMDEHTWLSSNSVRDSTSLQATEQITVKDSLAIEARALSDSLLRSGMATLANSISTGSGSLIVFNTLNWERSGLVEFDLNKNEEIFDPSTDETIPFVVVREENELNHMRFSAQHIPALGYKVYSLKHSGKPVSPATLAPSVSLESPYYRVKLDPESGAIRTIYDKDLHRELVNQQSDYRFGQYLYVTDANPDNNQRLTWYRGKMELQIHPAHNGKLLSVTRTPYGWEAHMESTATNTPAIATEIRLFEHEKKIEFIEDLNKDEVPSKEAVYFAFPFAMSHPQFRYEIQTGSMDPSKDMYPGAGHEWFSVQHWASVQQDGLSATVLPLDVPLVTLGDLDRGTWTTEFGDRPGTIFSFAMNNYWEDNYRASQGGNFRFRYVITSAPSTDEGKLSRLGWEEMTPMETEEVTHQDKALNQTRLLNGKHANLTGSLACFSLGSGWNW